MVGVPDDGALTLQYRPGEYYTRRPIVGHLASHYRASVIVSLARSLGMKTIAEGVESAEQLDFLRERGCNEVQGFQQPPARKRV